MTFETEFISDIGGYQHTGGTGRSCWGYNQSNIVRHGEDLYALVWRDDIHLVVYHRKGAGEWEASPFLPESPQSGALLVDTEGRVHLIAGAKGSYHLCFDPPGQVQQYTIQRLATADTRFGASIAKNGDILVAGGVPAMRWYLLSAKDGYAPVQSGCVPHETNRGYYFVAFDGHAGQITCCQIHYVEEAGFLTTQTYYYHNPDVAGTPDDWRLTVVGDLAETFDGKARGTTGNDDLLIDRQGRVHILYMLNPLLATGAWAGGVQNRAQDVFCHAVGAPGGPFTHYRLGNFSRGRLCQTADGRFHYLLTRPGKAGTELCYAVGEEDTFDTISEPTPLELPCRMDHFFVNNARAGSTLADVVDVYFTAAAPETNKIWYGRLSVS